MLLLLSLLLLLYFVLKSKKRKRKNPLNHGASLGVGPHFLHVKHETKLTPPIITLCLS